MTTESQSAFSFLRELARKQGLNLRDLRDFPLEGLWRDVKLSEQDIEDAKKSLFKESD